MLGRGTLVAKDVIWQIEKDLTNLKDFHFMFLNSAEILNF